MLNGYLYISIYMDSSLTESNNKPSGDKNDDLSQDKNDSLSSSSNFVYQTNLYYGIHYDMDEENNIMDALKSHRKFKQLVTENEVKINKYNLIMNKNSDIPNEATLGLIFVDQMSIMGDEMDSPEECYLRLEPHRMLKLERIHKHGAELVTDVHDVIIQHFKKKGIFTHGCVYLGWQAMTCTWDDDNAGSLSKS